MNVYAMSFEGKYPVGAYAVVVAPNEEEAKKMLIEHVGTQHGLAVERPWVTRINTDEASVLVLSDGDY